MLTLKDHFCIQINGGYRCTVCEWEFTNYPRSSCPGVKRLKWGEHSNPNLMTKSQLGKAGYKNTPQHLPPPSAALWHSKETYWIPLYDLTQCKKKAPMSDKQKAALQKAQAQSRRVNVVCQGCRHDYVEVTQKRATEIEAAGGYTCDECRYANKARAAALSLLSPEEGGCVILDTETTGLWNAEIVEIAMIDHTGAILLNTLVKPLRPERMFEEGKKGLSAYDIHGIHPDSLKDAPDYPSVYQEIRRIVEGRRVVIYNEEYDTGIIGAQCEEYQLPYLESAGIYCAMQLNMAYHKTRRWLALNGGHRALGDCQATLSLLEVIAGVENGVSVARGEG